MINKLYLKCLLCTRNEVRIAIVAATFMINSLWQPPSSTSQPVRQGGSHLVVQAEFSSQRRRTNDNDYLYRSFIKLLWY